jgi:predicted nucleic acid-binding protein
MADILVIDASAYLAVLLNEPGSETLTKILEERPLLAPSLIRYETANALLIAHRCGRIPSLDRLQFIEQYPIAHPPRKHWWPAACNLVRKTNLTFYDASYAGVAKALDSPLLTLDIKLKKACQSQNIPLLKPTT